MSGALKTVIPRQCFHHFPVLIGVYTRQHPTPKTLETRMSRMKTLTAREIRVKTRSRQRSAKLKKNLLPWPKRPKLKRTVMPPGNPTSSLVSCRGISTRNGSDASLESLAKLPMQGLSWIGLLRGLAGRLTTHGPHITPI